MTKYVVSGYIGFDNFGDEAIAGILTSHLKDVGAEKITLLSSNPIKTSQLYSVNSSYMLDFIKPIIESDVLISGGGSLLQDVTSLKSLMYYLAVIMTALVMGKKVIIFAQGFTPFRTKIGKFLTTFVLKKCHKISVRDVESKKFLDSLKIKSQLVSDPVFAINIGDSQEHNGIGVQLRDFEGLDDSFLEALAKEISNKFGDEEIKLISLQDSCDIKILDKFASFGLKTRLVKNLSVKGVVKEISELEYLVGMRFHSLLVGARAGVKILGIDYDVKVEKLAKQVGFPIIKMNQKDLKDSFDELCSIKTGSYNIPTFVFPEL